MTFEELGVSEDIRHSIEELGFAYPMPIQEAVIPFLLGEKDNLIALAQTGTGKTAAYGIPVLQGIDPDNRDTQALILSPTRELCLQISDDLNDFAKHTENVRIVPVYGGTGMEQQIRALRHGAQIIVATPGRLIDLKNRGVAKLDNVKTVVLDEADEMLNMGFQEDIEDIFNALPQADENGAEARKLLFSATMSKEVEKVAKRYLGAYKEIVVGSRNEGAENVNHVYYLVHAKDKYLALKRIVDYYPKIYAIIFCRTKLETQEIADKLIKDGYNAESLHGDLSQPQRDQTMQKFRRHTVQLLVATDVAARGLDVDDLTHVINYGMPDDIESYTHRSGRTGRAGKNGTSISIIHVKERSKVRNIEKVIGKKFVDGTLPTPNEICTKQLYKAMDDIMKMDVDEELIEPFMEEINRHFEFVDKEDILKKIVTMTFGRFLSYYADAPEIEKPTGKKERNDSKNRKERGTRTAEEGYERLFINLGKDNGFYPGVCMQFLNKHLGGRQKVGHIDLFSKFAYIEVPSEDAEYVMSTINGVYYRGIQVRCNPSEDKSHAPENTRRNDRGGRRDHAQKDSQPARKARGNNRRGAAEARRAAFEDTSKWSHKNDWRQFFTGNDAPGGKKKKGKKGGNGDFVGEMPDFSEEGWARRKPKKK
jgi:ATP-dependent RNA helicase DeaD